MRIAYIAPYQGAELLKRRPIVRNLSLAANVKMEVVAELLESKSHEVEILSQGEVVENHFRYYKGFREAEGFGAHFPIYYSSAFPLRFLNGTASSMSLLSVFKARHRAHAFAAVIIYNLKPPQVACANYAINVLKLPVILDYNDDAFSGVWSCNGSVLTSKFYLAKARKLMGSIAASIGCTPYLLTQVPDRTPKLLLRGVVNSDIANSREEEDSPRKNWVVFCGTFERTQGLEQLIQAWQEGGLAGWELHIAGRGPLAKMIKDSAIDGSNIVFHGFLNRKENARLLGMAKIGMNPQDAPKIRGAVFAFKVIEYLAAGLHVVTTRLGTVEPELEIGIEYIEDNRPGSIAAGLKNVIDNRLFERNAKDATLQRYGPEAAANSIDSLLNKL